MGFSRTPGLLHGNKDFAEEWDWQDQFTAEEWAESTSFSTNHLSIPTRDLGRTPYNTFQFAPEQWVSEGSLHGVLSPRMELRPTRCHPRPDVGYEEWCERQGLPVIGNQIPVARFNDDLFLAQVPTVVTMRLEQ